MPVALTKVTPAGSVSVTLRFAASDGPAFDTVTEYATEEPATTVAGPVLVMARSADAVTVVVAVAVLFAALGSAVVAATLAVLLRLEAWFGAVTVTVISGAEAPVASAGRVQVTDTLPVFEQAQPVPAALTKVTPAGSVSVTVRPAASDGPLFVTVNEYATEDPATTVAGPVLAIARSAEAVTPVVTDEELLAAFGSAVVAATLAVLVSDAACAGAVTVTVITGAVTPVAKAALVQVTDTLPVFAQAQPVPPADTNVTPAGSVSVTVRLAASDGPLFVTVSEYATDPPATTDAGPVFAIDRSASAVTAVDAVAVLLAAFGSAVVDAIAAVLDSDAA